MNFVGYFLKKLGQKLGVSQEVGWIWEKDWGEYDQTYHYIKL